MIAALILAAGESSRMGTDKACLNYKNHTFLETILNTLREAGVQRTAVVLGHHAEEIQRSVMLEGAEVVINPDFRRGQTSSLQMGLKALESQELEGIVLCLVDHPAVCAQTVRQVVDAFSDSLAPVVIPTYQGRRGHPVVIGRQLFGELKSLGTEAGANTIVQEYREATQFVEVNDPGILLDIDDPDSYRRSVSPTC
jgi:molybdenum cofactor cytidylyltransferase